MRAALLLLLASLWITPPLAAKQLAVVKPAISCASLAATDLTDIGGPGSRVRSAQQTQVNGSDVCVVDGTLAPQIIFRLRLPLHNWTQRYLQTGCGGFCGQVGLYTSAADGCEPLASGDFAVASTDMGHNTPGGVFGHDPQLRVDFAYRGVHLTAVAAKKLIAAFYRQPQAFSYFSGCSDGGREALMEAQRYPQDFNGIIAGAPSLIFVVQNGLFHPWQAVANRDAQGRPILLANKLPLLHRAVLAQCDGLDGQVDGLLSDPRLCQVKLDGLRCQADAAIDSCLSDAEIGAVQRLYDGPRDPLSGGRLTIGGPLPGSELAWVDVFVPREAQTPSGSWQVASEALRGVVFEQNPRADFTPSDLPFTAATLDKLRVTHPLYDASNPDLSAFAAAGNKLLLWHGWADQRITPLNSIAYHQALQTQLGKARVATFERLYMLPGLYHCSGGEGPSHFDLLTPLMHWVENGQAPEAITAFNDNPRISRPLFPYPHVATYTGKGDPNQASSYQAGPALIDPPPVQWLGNDLLKPYAPREH